MKQSTLEHGNKLAAQIEKLNQMHRRIAKYLEDKKADTAKDTDESTFTGGFYDVMNMPNTLEHILQSKTINLLDDSVANSIIKDFDAFVVLLNENITINHELLTKQLEELQDGPNVNAERNNTKESSPTEGALTDMSYEHLDFRLKKANREGTLNANEYSCFYAGTEINIGLVKRHKPDDNKYWYFQSIDAGYSRDAAHEIAAFLEEANKRNG